MDKGLYVAMTGAQATMRAQSTIAHNLANADTIGFKAALASTEAFRIQGEGLPTRVDAVRRIGGFDARSGALMSTGNPLDVALADDHWLAVQDAAGNEAWTRAGDLSVDANGLLRNGRGDLVLGEDGAPLAVPPAQSVDIGTDGTLSMTAQGEGPEAVAIVGRLRIAQIDPATLERGEDGLMRVPADAEPPLQAIGSVLDAGALERSNVDAATSLVEMISLARQFEMNVRVIKAGDENAQASNSLLRLS